MLLYGMMAACAVLAGIMVYRYDLHDREPWYALLLATVMGALTMWGAGRVEVAAMTWLGRTAAANWNPSMAAAAAVCEETAKLLVVVLIADPLPRLFNDPMDGIIYGSFAGLGAALEESASLMGWPGGYRLWEFLPAQEPVRILGHLVMGGIGGFGVGLLRPVRRRWVLRLCVTFACAVALHFWWDIVAFSATDAGQMLPWHKGAAVGLMLTGLVVYWRLVHVGEGMSRAWFAHASNEPAPE